MLYSTADLKNLDHKSRLKLINAVSGIKPANLIGSASKDGNTNLAIFNSVFHLGSDPALIGMIMRPVEEVPRHTYQNILETGYYTINHVHHSFIEKAHYTSAKVDAAISEFDRCGLQPEYVDGFPAPFVRESKVKMGMRFVQDLLIPQNQTRMIIGEIELLSLPEDAWIDNDIDLERTGAVGISGLNSYYQLTKIARFPYARANEIPDFANEDV
ncbi:flavin reductase [Robertkochia sp. 1368]|nr:flavin reductase [Robertkochia sediminum]